MNEKYTILAVDDTAESLALLVEILTPAGYQVRPADSGDLALAAVAANLPDLILLDVRMEGLDGLEVCRRLKAREETRHIPIILVSAFADVKEWVEGLQRGAADFITKPFQPEELLTRVKTHLALKQAKLSLKQQEARLRQTNEQLQAEISKCRRVENKLRQSLEQAERSHRALLSGLEDQKQAEETLRQSEIKHRTLVENLPQKIFMKARNSVYISCNENYARDLKIRPEEIVGKTDYDFYPRELAEKYIADDKRIMDSIKTEEIEERYIQDGEERFVHTTKTFVKDEQGNVIGLLGIFWDITERKKAEEELQKAYQELKDTYIQLTQAGKLAAMGEMAAGVVHELTQPLLGIKGFSMALLENLKCNLPTETSQQALSDLEVILQQTERMVELLSTIRDFARASGTEMSPLDINKPIEAALLLFSEQLRLNNIVVGKNLARDLPLVRGNANQLQQVFINLISNARDALDAKGGERRLTVHTERSPKEASILIEVIDNGIGADAETLSKMFEPFFTTRKADGDTGLGLSIVARIIKEHKGTLDVQSKPGGGCKFSIRLPLSAK